MSDWNLRADVEAVRVDRNSEGQIRSETHPIEVKLNLFKHREMIFEPDEIDNEKEIEELAEKYEPGEKIDDMYEGGAFARVKYEFDGSVARASRFKEVSSRDSGKGDWSGLDFVTVLPVADEVVGNIPGVERIEPAKNVLGQHIADGDAYEIDPE